MIHINLLTQSILISVNATVTAKEAKSMFFSIETSCGDQKVLNQTKLTVYFS